MSDDFEKVLARALGFQRTPGPPVTADEIIEQAEHRARMARHDYHLRRLILRRVLRIGMGHVKRIQVRPGQPWTVWNGQ